MSEILVVGDLMIDVVVSMQSTLNENSDTPCTIAQTIGGTAINVATWARSVGAAPHIVGCVGKDVGGTEIRNHLDSWEISHDITEQTDFPTGMVVALAQLDGERSMFPDSRANSALKLQQFEQLDWSRFSHLYISGYTLINRNTMELGLHLMQLARGHGVKVVLDPASAAPIAKLTPTEIRKWILNCDLLLPNEYEFSALMAVLSCEAADILAMCETLIVKNGAGGAKLFHAHNPISFEAPKVKVVDSVGAGDAFAGTLLGLLSLGHTLEASISDAVKNSTDSVTNRGAQPVRV